MIYSPSKTVTAAPKLQKTSPIGIPPFPTWEVRPAVPTDVGFILDSWCSDESTHVGRKSNEDPEVGKIGMRQRAMRLLSSCRCVVVRPTAEWFTSQNLPLDPRFLLGWCLYSFDRATVRPIVHFVYVKGPFRKQGLADAMLHAAGVRADKPAWCTHDRLWLGRSMKARQIYYNKYLLEYDPTAPAPSRSLI